MSPTPRKRGNYGALGTDGEPLGSRESGLDGAAGSDEDGLLPLAEPAEFAFIAGAVVSDAAEFGEPDRCFIAERNFAPTVSAAPTLLSPALPFMLAESENEPAAGAVAPLEPGADSLPDTEFSMAPRFIESLPGFIEPLADGLPAALMSAAA